MKTMTITTTVSTEDKISCALQQAKGVCYAVAAVFEREQDPDGGHAVEAIRVMLEDIEKLRAGYGTPGKLD